MGRQFLFSPFRDVRVFPSGFTISKTYRTAWRWAFLNSLLKGMSFCGHHSLA
jgi:hypothetical protein